jgi:hypothetical protein
MSNELSRQKSKVLQRPVGSIEAGAVIRPLVLSYMIIDH